MKKYIKTILGPKGTFTQLWFLIYQKLTKKRYQNNHNFFFQNHIKICEVTSVFHLNYTKKFNTTTLNFCPSKPGRRKTLKRRRYLAYRSYAEQSSPNDVNFLLIEISSKKGRRNDVDFLSIKITSKKYVEMKWKFIGNLLSTYRRQTDAVCPVCSHLD